MTAFQEHMRRAGERALEALPAPLRSEIYVISFRIWRHDSFDHRHPYLAIGYNTESEVRRVVAAGGEPGEVRWSYAYACVGLARHLHASGALTRILGRPVPIVPFDMYRAGYEPELAEAANPPEVLTDYLAWARAQEEE
ncbi:hypothetical protein ACWGCP_02500 [Streptomyces niveus]